MEVDTGWNPQGVDSCRIIGASWTFVKKTKKFRKKKLTKWSVCRKIICQLGPVYQQFGRNFLESVIYVWGNFSSGLDLAWRHNGSGDYASSWDTTCGMPDASAVPYSSLPSDDDVLWNKLQIFLWTKKCESHPWNSSNLIDVNVMHLVFKWKSGRIWLSNSGRL